MSDWISVKDQLPDEGISVLVAMSTGPEPHDWDMAVMYRYQHWCWRGHCAEIADKDSGFHDDYYRTVTHWRPLDWDNRP